ncbi:DUF5916 domain-containing protein [Tenacibaculum sp. TC6]|uniref:DUF5916 domain-containing protein n=1 Tax=Tenacibaculum sp. TC6 TaxID=3423223 RepID=UPI003D3623F1
MYKLQTLIYWLFFLLSVHQVVSQNNVIPFKKETVTLDGQLDEEVWKIVPEYTGFSNYMPTDKGLAENQTSVKIFHNKNYMFISAVYNDTTEKTQVSTLKRDVSIAFSDAFIMIFDTQNQEQNAYFFAVNSLGNQSDGLIERRKEGYNLSFSWNAVWKSKTAIQGNKKIYEIAIPLKALNYDAKQGVFGVQFYTRDIKNNSWTILKRVDRNYPTFDLRFTEKFKVDSLPAKLVSRFSVTPSFTVNYQEELKTNHKNTSYKPSLDVQYNLSSSLKLDATLNPDFSQIEVDQQVTNLTRFSVFFPERRNFFLENSDLFSNLGVDEVNPFYSRRIGEKSTIQFGLKLSGNLTSKTRIGALNVQTSENEKVSAQNFGVLVAEQQLSKNFTTTLFAINKQEVDGFKFVADYNRVIGGNLNYKSNNKKWLGVFNYAKSFSENISDKNTFVNAGIWYNRRGLNWNASIKNVEKNYITEVGFTPRLYNYDAVHQNSVREGYMQTTFGAQYEKFYEHSKSINSIRLLNYSNDTYYDEDKKLNQISHYLNSAVFFKDLSALYYIFNYNYVHLKYGFDALGNGHPIQTGIYKYGTIKLGYNSANNQQFRYQFNVQKGTYYGGKRTTGEVYTNYQLLPFANLALTYQVNKIDLNELGKDTFHLARFTGELFFNNQLNWTTYVQYNTQRNAFNVSSRL